MLTMDLVCYDWLRLGVDGSVVIAPIKEKSAAVEVDVKIIDTTAKLEAVAV